MLIIGILFFVTMVVLYATKQTGAATIFMAVGLVLAAIVFYLLPARFF